HDLDGAVELGSYRGGAEEDDAVASELAHSVAAVPVAVLRDLGCQYGRDVLLLEHEDEVSYHLLHHHGVPVGWSRCDRAFRVPVEQLVDRDLVEVHDPVARVRCEAHERERVYDEPLRLEG